MAWEHQSDINYEMAVIGVFDVRGMTGRGGRRYKISSRIAWAASGATMRRALPA